MKHVPSCNQFKWNRPPTRSRTWHSKIRQEKEIQLSIEQSKSLISHSNAKSRQRRENLLNLLFSFASAPLLLPLLLHYHHPVNSNPRKSRKEPSQKKKYISLSLYIFFFFLTLRGRGETCGAVAWHSDDKLSVPAEGRANDRWQGPNSVPP